MEKQAGTVGTDHPLTKRVWRLQERMHMTSTSRFSASVRIKFDWNLAQLTVVVLSLWSIVISYLLLPETRLLAEGRPIGLFRAVGILLPVFIVVFSLIEHGENYLRAHQLDVSGRQLRELGDKLAAAVADARGDEGKLLEAFKFYSLEYNHSLERCPVSHSDVDYFQTRYGYIKSGSKYAKWYRIYALSILTFFWFWRHIKRAFYFSLWIAPAILFFVAM